jgi:NAD(P)-dependent dehydrogenase (short-subunit alcohol dehydrogenase family)
VKTVPAFSAGAGAGARRRHWTAIDIDDQRGRTAVVTGANSGLGLATARLLAGCGATVVLACRDTGRALAAAGRIRAEHPGADVRVERLDLASLASVRAAASRITAAYPRLDLLINNAGVMNPPGGLTEDGVEATFAANHLGHFALTGLLLPRLLATPGSRIVSVASLAHLCARSALGTGRLPYPRSKLANLTFAYELDRRLGAAGARTVSLAAHPGIARTALPRNLNPAIAMFLSPRMAPVMSWLIQGADVSALAVARGALDPAARGGQYYGPSGAFGATGHPGLARSTARARDPERGRALWAASERLTGVTYAFTPPVAAPLPVAVSL